MFIGLEVDGLLCVWVGVVFDKDDNGVYVLGVVGEYVLLINEYIDNVKNKNIVE